MTTVLLILSIQYILFFSVSTSATGIHNNVGIIGGHQININDVPFMASLKINGKGHNCGASIIHEKFILTAAHCIKPNRDYIISVGSDHINNEKHLYYIDKIILPPEYIENTYDYDICVIKLNESLTFGPNVNKIELDIAAPEVGSLVQATGWGRTPSGYLSQTLLQVSVPVISSEDCQRKFKTRITDRMICAGDVGKDTCNGDSGGPLRYKNKQVGIISFGMKPCGISPGVFTNIGALRNWVIDTINKNL